MLKFLIDLLFILVSIFFVFINIYELLRKKNKAILYVYPMIFIFNVLPTIIHIFFGQADYMYFKLANVATADSLSNMIYEVIMVFIIITIWFISYYDFKIKKLNLNSDQNKITINLNKELFLNCMLALQIIPIVIALIVPKYRGNFLSYGARYTVEGVVEIPPYILGVATAAFLFYLLNTNKKYWKRNILSCILIITAIYLRGSRAIIATVVAMGLYAILLSNKLDFKKVLKLLFLIIPLFMIFFYGYHLFFRDASESFYSYYSIDFSRDYTTIFSIYARLNGIDIVEYFGQSLLFCLIFWIPRSLFSCKPYPFPTYITLALLGSDLSQVDFLTLRTTTNIFSESIANLGITLGVMFIVIILLVIMYFIDKVHNLNYKYLLIYLSYEILTLDLSNWIISFSIIAFIILLLENSNEIIKLLKRYINHD